MPNELWLADEGAPFVTVLHTRSEVCSSNFHPVMIERQSRREQAVGPHGSADHLACDQVALSFGVPSFVNLTIVKILPGLHLPAQDPLPFPGLAA